jgi:hypothetical protein
MPSAHTVHICAFLRFQNQLPLFPCVTSADSFYKLDGVCALDKVRYT